MKILERRCKLIKRQCLSGGVGGDIIENVVAAFNLVAMTLFRISSEGLVLGKVVCVLIHVWDVGGARVETMDHGIIKLKVGPVVSGEGHWTGGRGFAPETSRLGGGVGCLR